MGHARLRGEPATAATDRASDGRQDLYSLYSLRQVNLTRGKGRRLDTSNEMGQPPAALERLKQTMRRHPLFFYFLMAYAFSWIVSIP